MRARTFTAILRRQEDLYVALCPEAGTIGQGCTIEEALANLKEATELHLRIHPLREAAPPLLTTFEATA
jgi:predicted RNase H-like HicB family nuclease